MLVVVSNMTLKEAAAVGELKTLADSLAVKTKTSTFGVLSVKGSVPKAPVT
jgi:hypothetical protein